jgi:nucleotide-binding universal stress UspA family protein
MSRRGAEIGLALAHATNSKVGALFVAPKPEAGKRRKIRDAVAGRRSERAILKDIAELADNFDTKMTIAARTDAAPEDAILREAKRGSYDLIVMGVNRRPGEDLYFGRVPAAILAAGEVSVLFVASEAYAQERRPTEHAEQEEPAT